MENLLDVMRAMGKATAREIAARMKIQPPEALETLREYEERLEVKFLNGYWQVADKQDVVAPATGKVIAVRSPKAPKTAKEPKRAAAKKCAPKTDSGKSVKVVAPAPAIVTLPAITAKTNDLVIPAPRYLTKEIRRTKAKLARLEKLQAAMRELRRNKNLLREIGEVQ